MKYQVKDNSCEVHTVEAASTRFVEDSEHRITEVAFLDTEGKVIGNFKQFHWVKPLVEVAK
jgi:hypothetical protein